MSPSIHRESRRPEPPEVSDRIEAINTKSKNTTLIYAPVIGLLVVGSTFATRESGAPEAAAAMGLAIMLIFLAAHWSSIRRAAG